MKANNPLTLQRVETPYSMMMSSDINSSTKEVEKMCEAKSEFEGEEELKVLQKQELRVLQKQPKEEGKKDPAENSDGCCEPLCSPITCGP